MAAADDLDEVLEQYHLALDEIVKGSAEGYKRLYSRRDDVTLANPFGPPARGWDEVAKTLERAAAHYRDGEATGFENVAKFLTLLNFRECPKGEVRRIPLPRTPVNKPRLDLTVFDSRL